MFVRPTRSALVRTRLPAEAVLESLAELVSREQPTGTDGFLAHGYFLEGHLEGREFRVAYHFNSHKNPQTYDVRGVVQDSPDWRIIRLTIKARSPWISAVELGAFAIGMSLVAYGEYRGPQMVVGGLVLILSIYGFANLLFIPDRVRNRVAEGIAARVRGAVQQFGQWVVPPRED